MSATVAARTSRARDRSSSVVATRTAHPVQFPSTGSRDLPRKTPPGGPMGIAIDARRGEVLVARLGALEIGEGNFPYSSAVTTSADGRIWVSDELRHSVQVFDSAGSYLGAVGGQGVAPGDFLYASALASKGTTLLAVDLPPVVMRTPM